MVRVGGMRSGIWDVGEVDGLGWVGSAGWMEVADKEGVSYEPCVGK